MFRFHEIYLSFTDDEFVSLNRPTIVELFFIINSFDKPKGILQSIPLFLPTLYDRRTTYGIISHAVAVIDK